MPIDAEVEVRFSVEEANEFYVWCSQLNGQGIVLSKVGEKVLDKISKALSKESERQKEEYSELHSGMD